MRDDHLNWYIAPRYLRPEDHTDADQSKWVERLECPATSGNPLNTFPGMSRIHCYDAKNGTCLVGMSLRVPPPKFPDWKPITLDEAKAHYKAFFETKVVRIIGDIIAVEDLERMGTLNKARIRGTDGQWEDITIQGVLYETGPNGEDEVLCTKLKNTYDCERDTVIIGRICLFDAPEVY